MKRIIQNPVITILILSLLIICNGCSNQAKVEKVNPDEVTVYADVTAAKIFSGLSEGDYTKFAEDFDDKMKEAISKEQFQEIANQLGKYQSKEIADADKVQGYIRVYYKTRFSKISTDVIFTIVFPETGEKKVAGLFYK
jgi:hypothetical protein